ncbi:hypothetical protein ABTK12_19210, partial [Acinetobacter baumannii]
MTIAASVDRRAETLANRLAADVPHTSGIKSRLGRVPSCFNWAQWQAAAGSEVIHPAGQLTNGLLNAAEGPC